MKTTNYGVLMRVLVVTMAFSAIFLMAGSRVNAQANTQQFKVGDRVEVDTMWSQHPENSTYWRKGIVVRLYDPEDHFGGLIIKMDEDGHEFRHRFVDKQWIRPVQGTDAKPDENNQPGDPAEVDQTTKNDTGGCPPTDDVKGTSQSAKFKSLIIDRYERNGKSRDENEKQVSVSVHFSDFKTGATHPYRHIINNPDGNGGVAGGAVYPVKASYLVCADYPGYAPTHFKGEYVKTEYENMTYSCFKDATGDWICNQTGGHQGRPQHIPK